MVIHGICIILSKQVYINTSNVDDYLVESITRPAADPNAGEVYYRYIYILKGILVFDYLFLLLLLIPILFHKLLCTG